jgi:beta-lactamase class A
MNTTNTTNLPGASMSDTKNPPFESLAVCVPGLLESRADEVLPLASVGKLLLLAEIARGLEAGELDQDEPLEPRAEDYCGGSGLLAELSSRRWTLQDLVLLTAAVSDNTATNALIRRIGLDRVNARAQELGLRETRLLDKIREPRLPSHPPTFAVGTARELAALATLVAGAEPWARRMLGWLAANTDRGQVAASIPHDPEERAVPDADAPREPGSLWLANKTGTDTGTRADVGIVLPADAPALCYAVIGRCPPGEEHELIRAMRAVGLLIARAAQRPAAP